MPLTTAKVTNCIIDLYSTYRTELYYIIIAFIKLNALQYEQHTVKCPAIVC